ncbi:unnamed protein product [Closterium sp. NIES-53]
MPPSRLPLSLPVSLSPSCSSSPSHSQSPSPSSSSPPATSSREWGDREGGSEKEGAKSSSKGKGGSIPQQRWVRWSKRELLPGPLAPEPRLPLYTREEGGKGRGGSGGIGVAYPSRREAGGGVGVWSKRELLPGPLAPEPRLPLHITFL